MTMTWLCAFGITVFVSLVLAALGRKGKKRAKDANGNFVWNDKKAFPFMSVISVGYGVLRILPWLAENADSELRHMYYARAREPETAGKRWEAFLANLIAGIIVCVAMALGAETALIYAHVDHTTETIVSCMIGVVAAAIPVRLYKVAKDAERTRTLRICKELPNVINKMIMFLDSGRNMTSVLRKLGSTDYDHPIYEELRTVRTELDNNIPVVTALRRLKERCVSSEMTRLYMILEQNVTKGTSDCDLALQELAVTLWHERNEEARREGAKVKEKLLLPTMLLFVVVLILCVVPAFSMLGSF